MTTLPTIAGFQSYAHDDWGAHPKVAAASAGQWAIVHPHMDLLVEAIGTPESIRLAACACYNSDEPERTLALIDRYRQVTDDAPIPPTLHRLRAGAQKQMGRLPQAWRDSQRLSLETNDPCGPGLGSAGRRSCPVAGFPHHRDWFDAPAGARDTLERFPTKSDTAPAFYQPSPGALRAQVPPQRRLERFPS